MGAAGTEDQFLYLDDDGNYHAVFHHTYGTGMQLSGGWTGGMRSQKMAGLGRIRA